MGSVAENFLKQVAHDALIVMAAPIGSFVTGGAGCAEEKLFYLKLTPTSWFVPECLVIASV